MRRKFPTSIYSGWPRWVPGKPAYRKATLLDVVRAARKVDAAVQRLKRMEARERTVRRIMSEAGAVEEYN